MAEVVNSWQQGAFTTPINGTTNDASVVLSNDNAVRGKYNSHDADPGIHLQSSVLASRPAAGTAGRKWLSTDGLRVYYDTGAAWSEIAYLPLAGGTVTGAVATGALTVTGAMSASTTITAGTGLTVTVGQINVAGGQGVTAAGDLAFVSTGNSTVSFNVFSANRVVITSAYVGSATDGAVDLGQSAAANRFRDLFLSRNALIGGTLGVTGAVATGALSATTGAFSGALTVSSGGAAITGASTVTGSLNVTTDLVVDDDLTVSGDAQFTGPVSVNDVIKLDAGGGGDAAVGNATLVGGTVTVNTTKATATAKVLLTRKTTGGTIGTAITYTINVGVSFTITSDNPLDTSTFTWVIFDTV